MNLAGVRRLPVVFVIDNNQWAYSTPAHLEYAVDHLADRAAAYGFDGVVVDGTDVLAVYREAKRAIEKAREGGGPTLIESVTLRMEGHAVHDDAFYVPKELFEEWAQRDPIERFRGWLRDNASMTDDEEDEIRAGVKRILNDAIQRAEESPHPRSGIRARRRLRDARGARDAAPQVGGATMAEKTYLQAISDGLRQEMRRDQRVFVLGEDVGVYGGAFKVTQGFQEEFGASRVLDMPLSETAIVGGATGAALMGLRPVAEMQFADFVSCAWDHLVTVAASNATAPGRPSRSCCGCRPAAASRAARSTRRTPSRASRTSRASRSSARRRRRTRRACSPRRSRTRTPSSTSSTSTCTAGSRARCPTTGTRPRSGRRACTATATT